MTTNPRDSAPAARRRTRRLGRRLLMLVGAVVVAAGAVGGWYYWQHRMMAFAVATPPQPVYVVIKPFVVTVLDDNQATRFVQVGIDLEVADKRAADRVEQTLPAIQDAIRLAILQSKIAEVTSPQGVEKLRKEFIARANSTVNSVLDPPPDPHAPKPKVGQPVAPLPVRNVYFTELVVE